MLHVLPPYVKNLNNKIAKIKVNLLNTNLISRANDLHACQKSYYSLSTSDITLKIHITAYYQMRTILLFLFCIFFTYSIISIHIPEVSKLLSQYVLSNSYILISFLPFFLLLMSSMGKCQITKWGAVQSHMNDKIPCRHPHIANYSTNY